MTEPTNEMVAELVMGWVKDVLDGSVNWYTHDSYRIGPWRPLQSVEHDFIVFQRVRKWIDEAPDLYEAFYNNLAELLRSHNPYYRDTINQNRLYYMDEYQPGDYSRAALAALKQEAGTIPE